ncbi:hypothetical protein H6P81_006076 [Aristolochia fimbriata]|uniref:Retrovirus-related Pol polyprotein from transposon TNT 1-94-like beta-barrel domain-containing protein n=1 Tax=Aristolochia fimbriata TaxID=158543 RepID=A0AAV7EWG3_ARIFI|nr:hypothetical protein H6P81_006076 [Aristolochia fimbriata]
MISIETSEPSSAKALEEWEINNSRAITQLASVVSPSISSQVGKFEFAVDAWSFMEKVMDPKFECDKDTLLLQRYIDEIKLVQLLMALRDDYEFVRSSMLHRSPLPFIESALSELLSEETRRLTRGPLALLYVPLRPFWLLLLGAPLVPLRLSLFTYPKLKNSPPTTTARHSTAASASSVVPTCAELPSSSTLTALDVQDMITKALSGLGQGTSALTLSAHSGKSSWIIDSGASNHMSSDSSLFVSTTPSCFSPICTVDGSKLSVSHVGSICAPSGFRLSDVLWSKVIIELNLCWLVM